jgi:hypothetical protein
MSVKLLQKENDKLMSIGTHPVCGTSVPGSSQITKRPNTGPETPNYVIARKGHGDWVMD